jgi:hypothetical protein
VAYGHVVDERRAAGQPILGHRSARSGVVRERLAGRSAGDPEQATPDLQPDRRPPRLRGNEDITAAGAHVAAIYGTRGDRADVERRALKSDALRLEADRQGDQLREGRMLR